MEGSPLLTPVELLLVSSMMDGKGPAEGRHQVARHPSAVAWHKLAESELARGPTRKRPPARLSKAGRLAQAPSPPLAQLPPQ